MKYYSTKNPNSEYSFAESVISGLAPDGGLFLPKEIPSFKNEVDELAKLSFHERTCRILKPFVSENISESALSALVEDVFNFPVITRTFDDSYSILELFHGPTHAFKDFGARFLARTLSHLLRSLNKKCVILVATSGDTGSAVANAFYGIEGIQVVLLYPKGKVSFIQEQQLTTFDKNITAFEIEGVFDDCQRLVKSAFMDADLMEQYYFTSANSINIARLLPQSIYYIESYLELYKKFDNIGFTVPSGNLGNISAGLLARQILGLDSKYTAALNNNIIFHEFMQAGSAEPRPSIETLSNAMDVGNPSNLERIISLFPNHSDLTSFISTFTFSDEETLEGIREFYSKYNYIIDPHTSVGYLGAKKAIELNPKSHQIILSTAHPAKFLNVIEDALNISPEIPENLQAVLKKEKKVVESGNGYSEFKEKLLQTVTH